MSQPLKKTQYFSMARPFTVALAVLAVGCAADAESVDLGSDQEERVIQKWDGSVDDRDAARESDRYLNVQLKWPYEAVEPGVSTPELNDDQLRPLVERLVHAIPAYLPERMETEQFVDLDLGGGVTTDAQAGPECRRHRYDATTGLLEVELSCVNPADLASPDGTIVCDTFVMPATPDNPGDTLVLDCRYSIASGGGEISGQAELRHYIGADVMRVQVSAKRDGGSGEPVQVNSAHFIGAAMGDCNTYESVVRVAQGDTNFSAIVSDLVRCENRCVANSGSIEVTRSEGSSYDHYTIAPGADGEWRLHTVAGVETAFSPCD